MISKKEYKVNSKKRAYLIGSYFSKKPCIRYRQPKPKRKQPRWLLQSFLMAHKPHRLVLLRPRPDTVHGSLLHKTLLSTFLKLPSLPQWKPQPAFNPTIADCRYRAPLTPHLARLYNFTLNSLILQQNFLIFHKKQKILYFFCRVSYNNFEIIYKIYKAIIKGKSFYPLFLSESGWCEPIKTVKRYHLIAYRWI